MTPTSACITEPGACPAHTWATEKPDDQQVVYVYGLWKGDLVQECYLAPSWRPRPPTIRPASLMEISMIRARPCTRRSNTTLTQPSSASGEVAP